MFCYIEIGSTFYFDTTIDELDKNKQYYIEVEDVNEKNLINEDKKKNKLEIPNQTIGNYQELHAIIEDSNITLTNEYSGNIATKIEEFGFDKNSSGKHYIYGYIKISVIIEGKEQKPVDLPSLTLKGEDGYSQTMYISDSGNGRYYFDTYIEDINKEQTYYIEASLTSENNIASEIEKTMKVEVPSQELGRVDEYNLVIENSNLQFIDGDKYTGIIKTKLEAFYLRTNSTGRHYICGNVVIKELVDGQERKNEKLPSLTLKGEDGYSQTMYISDSGNGNYYFDTYIEDLDKNQTYYIEARLTERNNIAAENEKTMKLEIPTQTLGKMGDWKVIIENSNIGFIDANCK